MVSPEELTKGLADLRGVLSEESVSSLGEEQSSLLVEHRLTTEPALREAWNFADTAKGQQFFKSKGFKMRTLSVLHKLFSDARDTSGGSRASPSRDSIEGRDLVMQWQAAVRPIKVDDECSGTAVRLKETGKFVSATHTVVENGRFLDAFIDGHPLKLIASFPREDIIFLEGPPGPHLPLASQGFWTGCKCYMLGYPEATSKVFGNDKVPICTAGRMSYVNFSDQLAAADYRADTPNSSGGAVISANGQLAGVHTSGIWHDSADISLVEDFEEAKASQELMEKDPDRMWPVSFAEGTLGDGSEEQADEGAAAEEEDSPTLEGLQASHITTKQYVVDTIPLKGHLGVFVPWFKLTCLMQKCGVPEEGVLWQAIPRQSKKSSRSAGTRVQKRTKVPAIGSKSKTARK